MAVIKQNISYGENKPERAFYGKEPLTAMYYKPDAETDPQLVYFYSEGTPGLRYTKGDSEDFLTIGDNKGFDFSEQGGALVTPAITYEYGDTNTIYKVTKMADHAFQGNTTLTSAVVDGNVTNIGDNAFNSCSHLKTITVGNSVETIANGGVNNCENLESIILGKKVREIGDWAFAFNPKLKIMTIPSSVISLGRNVFEACFGLVSIRCSAKLSEVPTGMCHGGSTDTDTMLLESVNFRSVKKIGEGAFYNCVKLKNINNRTSEASLVDLSDVQEIAGNAFYNCKGITNLHIGKKFKSAESTSFKGCTGIKTLTIPCALTARGTDDVPTLAYISKGTVSKLTITAGENYATDVTDRTYTEVKNGFGDINHTLPIGGLMTELVIDFEGYSNDKYNIADEAFLGCPNLKKVTLKNVRRMGKRVFRYCGSLETASIDIGSFSELIGQDTFESAGLTTLKLYGNNSIGDKVFRYSSNLTTVYIPKTIVSIGSEAFAYCSKLKDIYYSGTSSEWNSMTKGTDWDKGTGQYTLHTDWKYN